MKTLIALAAGALIAAPAFAQKMDNADESAMKQLASANLAEISGGKMAAAKAQNPEVKKFAQKMADDHQIMLNDLKSLASSKGLALPKDPSAMDMAEQKLLEHASTQDFDRKYMDHMVKDHEKDAEATQNIAAKAKDAQFKSAVQHAHAKIEEHLSLARSVHGKLSAATGSTAPSSK